MQMKRGKIATLERKKNFFSTTLVLVFFALTWFTSWMVIFSSHYHHSLLFNPFVDPWTDNVIGTRICVGLHLFVIVVFSASQFVAEIGEYWIFKAFTKYWKAVFSDTNTKWYLDAAVPEVDIDEECYELETAEVEVDLIVKGCWVTVKETFTSLSSDNSHEVPKGSLGKVIEIDEDGYAEIDFEQISDYVSGRAIIWKDDFRNILALNAPSMTQVMVVVRVEFTPRDSQVKFPRGSLGKIIEINDDCVARIEFDKESVTVSRDDFQNISVLSQGGLAVGRWVAVMVPFTSLLSQEVPKGSLGKVIKINEDGDALIDFDFTTVEKQLWRREFPDRCYLTGREQLVYKGDLRNIRVLNPLGLAAQKAEEAAQKAEEEEKARKKKEEAMRRNQCKICMQTFASRNQLFKHLATCGKIEPGKASSTTAGVLTISDHPMSEDRGSIVAADETMGREMSQAPQGAIHASAPPAPARATIGHLVSRLGASELPSESALLSESKHSPQPSPDRQGTTVEESLPPPCQSLM
jgi:hypothetical protein